MKSNTTTEIVLITFSLLEYVKTSLGPSINNVSSLDGEGGEGSKLAIWVNLRGRGQKWPKNADVIYGWPLIEVTG